MKTITVETKSAHYPVLIGHEILGELAGLIPTSTRSVVFCIDAGLPETPDFASFVRQGSRVVAVPSGEENKNFASLAFLCRQFAAVGVQRGDVIVAVGGGVVTDMVGLAASLFDRGVPVIHVPTTLLGQVDAAIGGKTAINIPEGKNLVGAFYQPLGVICDTAMLTTLSERERRSGLGEVMKCELVTGHDLLSCSEEEMVEHCVRWKVNVVNVDEREGGLRMILNYGHTLAHAIESVTSEYTHGEAVAVGLCFAAFLAERLGRIDQVRRDLLIRRVEEYGLPTRLAKSLSTGELMARMMRDKKRVIENDNTMTFVLDGPNGVDVVTGVEADLVAATLEDWMS